MVLEDRTVDPGMAFRRTDELQVAVLVFVVIPTREGGHPDLGLFKARKSVREVRLILGGAKETSGITLCAGRDVIVIGPWAVVIQQRKANAPKRSFKVGIVNARNSAEADFGVLRHLGQLCTAHRLLAINAAEWPLSTFAECVLPTRFCHWIQRSFNGCKVAHS